MCKIQSQNLSLVVPQRYADPDLGSWEWHCPDPFALKGLSHLCCPNALPHTAIVLWSFIRLNELVEQSGLHWNGTDPDA